MSKRRIKDEAEAVKCLAEVAASGLTLAGWSRLHGIDGRSLHSWRLNLARRELDPPKMVEWVPRGLRPDPAAVDLAFLWHMHQPSYRDPETGAPLPPWVRLHCCRSYFDMAWLLDRHPTIKATFQFRTGTFAAARGAAHRHHRRLRHPHAEARRHT